MARVYSGKRPQNLKRTLGAVSRYLGRHRVLIALVAVLAALSASANLLGTYMIRPIVNQVVAQGSVSGLMAGVGITAAIYAVGVLSTLGYTQIMVRAAQKILLDIRRDLYHRLQTLPLRFFDQNRKGDLMSLFTNDVDTISDALNNSFAVVIQSMVQLFGMVLLLFLLNWRLSILVLVGYGVMFAYIRYSSKRSKFYFDRQQEHLGSLDGYIEEMTAGQKVVKVFSHEPANLSGFRRRTEGGQGVQPRAGQSLRLPEAEPGPPGGGLPGPGLRRHHDPRGGDHLLLQLRHHRGAGGTDGAQRPVRPGQPGQLFGLCASVRHAHQPADPAGQLPPGGPGRRRAHFPHHGGGAGCAGRRTGR